MADSDPEADQLALLLGDTLKASKRKRRRLARQLRAITDTFPPTSEFHRHLVAAASELDPEGVRPKDRWLLGLSDDA